MHPCEGAPARPPEEQLYTYPRSAPLPSAGAIHLQTAIDACQASAEFTK